MGFQNVVVSHIEVEAALMRFLTRKLYNHFPGPKKCCHNRGSGRGGPDPTFSLLFHENPAQFCHCYPESRFSFSGKYIKKSYLQKTINAGCRLAPWIDILNLCVCLKVPAKNK